MSRQFICCVTLAVVFLGAGGGPHSSLAAEPEPSIPIGMTGAEGKIYNELDEPTKMDFEETPLGEVVDFIQEFHRINIQMRTIDLEKLGIGPDTPVTVRLQGVSLRSALNITFQSIDRRMTYRVADETLLITTSEDSRRNPAVRVYNVRKLLQHGGNAEKLAAAVARTLDARLAKANDQEVRDAQSRLGKNPDKRTGPATQEADQKSAKDVQRIAWYRDHLVVRATELGQHEVQAILEALDAGLKGKSQTRRAERDGIATEKRLRQSIADLKAKLKRARVKGGSTSTHDPPSPPFYRDPFAKPVEDLDDDPFGSD